MAETQQLYVWEAYNGEKWYTIGWTHDPLLPVVPLVMRRKDQADKMRPVAEAHGQALNQPVRLVTYVPIAIQSLPGERTR